jgi:hypothetical protein
LCTRLSTTVPLNISESIVSHAGAKTINKVGEKKLQNRILGEPPSFRLNSEQWFSGRPVKGSLAPGLTSFRCSIDYRESSSLIIGPGVGRDRQGEDGVELALKSMFQETPKRVCDTPCERSSRLSPHSSWPVPSWFKPSRPSVGVVLRAGEQDLSLKTSRCSLEPVAARTNPPSTTNLTKLVLTTIGSLLGACLGPQTKCFQNAFLAHGHKLYRLYRTDSIRRSR